MKLKAIKWKGFTPAVLWCALRDTAIYYGMILFIINFRLLIKQKKIIPVTTENIKIILIIFAIVFAANSVACALGGTTEDDDLGKPSSGLKSRVPSTLAVTAIVTPLAFIMLLFIGVVKL